MENIEIRKVILSDIEKLQEISKQTFLDTFSQGNSEENMLKYLEEGFSLDKLTREVNNKASLFYFALTDGRVIGYLKLNTGQSQTEIKDDKALEIERIYVLEVYHGKKIGQLLYDKAIDVAETWGAGYVWLGVWEKNLKAINFYKKNGFVEFDRHIFKLGDDEQTDIMMKKVLNMNINTKRSLGTRTS
jgi:GNAT superfamily N-acetyltransferase